MNRIPIVTPFSQFVRRRRIDLSLTQREIAQACNVTEQSIMLVEAGQRRLGLEHIPALAKALQVPANELAWLVLGSYCPQLAAALNPAEVQ